MATNAPITGAPTRAPFIPTPPAAISRVLATFDRIQLAGFVAVAIDLLDFADGDTDLEDATGVEDAFEAHKPDGPGCPVADTGEHVGDERDASFPEWRPGESPAPRFERGLSDALQLEDAEDDDSDRCIAGDDHMISGAVAQLEWRTFGHRDIGDETDAEREEGL